MSTQIHSRIEFATALDAPALREIVVTSLENRIPMMAAPATTPRISTDNSQSGFELGVADATAVLFVAVTWSSSASGRYGNQTRGLSRLRKNVS